MAKWIYKIEDSFETKNASPAADFVATVAFIIAVVASFSFVGF